MRRRAAEQMLSATARLVMRIARPKRSLRPSSDETAWRPATPSAQPAVPRRSAWTTLSATMTPTGTP